MKSIGTKSHPSFFYDRPNGDHSLVTLALNVATLISHTLALADLVLTWIVVVENVRDEHRMYTL